MNLPQDAVLQSFDEPDGMKDGVVSDPGGCAFDPGVDRKALPGRPERGWLFHVAVQILLREGRVKKATVAIVSNSMMVSPLQWSNSV